MSAIPPNNKSSSPSGVAAGVNPFSKSSRNCLSEVSIWVSIGSAVGSKMVDGGFVGNISVSVAEAELWFGGLVGKEGGKLEHACPNITPVINT